MLHAPCRQVFEGGSRSAAAAQGAYLAGIAEITAIKLIFDNDAAADPLGEIEISEIFVSVRIAKRQFTHGCGIGIIFYDHRTTQRLAQHGGKVRPGPGNNLFGKIERHGFLAKAGRHGNGRADQLAPVDRIFRQ
ncbi:hypothetical protein D3C80_1491390 [compost metagenome]